MLLKISDLEASYGDKLVLRGVSLEIERGRTAVLVGHNGAGKSTLLKSIFGLLSPRRGTICLDGEDINRLGPVERLGRGISYSPQGAEVFPTMTVQENLDLGGYTLSSRKDLQNSIRRMYELFPVLSDRRNLNAGSLSGGERQMLSMAIALMRAPRLFLLDEPSGGLAPKFVERVFDTISQVRKSYGSSILLVEQNLNEALAVADMVYVLAGGRITFQGSPHQFSQADEVGKMLLAHGE